MGFFKEFKDDVSQAVNELVDDTAKLAATDVTPDDNTMVDTLGESEVSGDTMEEEYIKKVMNMQANTEPDEPVMPKFEESQEPVVEKKAVEPTVTAKPVVEETAKKDTISDETAIITAGLRIKGDVESSGSIELLGSVEGNVVCKGKLIVSGVINGNSSSADFYANNATINGDIVSEGPAKLGNDSVVKGNLSATSAVIAGAIKGDIDVHGPVVVDTSAIVMGNIKSKSVQINNGAVIEGFCSQCYSDNSPKKFFGDN